MGGGGERCNLKNHQRKKKQSGLDTNVEPLHKKKSVKKKKKKSAGEVCDPRVKGKKE